MRVSKPQDSRDELIRDDVAWHSRGDEPAALTLPALIGFLLLVAVTLACVFYIAAQVVHTP